MINLENETDILASSLPNGIAWQNKYTPKNGQTESNLRKLLKGFANIFNQMRFFKENIYENELNIFTTTQLLNEYEYLVNANNGEFFPEGASEEERKRNVMLKLTLPRVTNLKNLQDAIKNIFKIDVAVIINGVNRARFPYVTFPIPFVGGYNQIHKIVFVQLPKSLLGKTFPYTFPIEFEKTDKETIERLIRWIAPVNKYIVFEYIL
jgi:hypothetical protein